MTKRFAGVAVSITTVIFAIYTTDASRGYSSAESCSRNVSELRDQFERRRADVVNPRVMEKTFAQAADLCAQGKYSEAGESLMLTIATCRYNGGCVIRNRT